MIEEEYTKALHGEYTMSQYATKEDLYADMRKELAALRRENEDLRARAEEVAEDLREASDLMDRVWETAPMGTPIRNKIKRTLALPTLGASERLRDKHYRECEEIAREYVEYAERHDDDEDESRVGPAILAAIARAREGK